MLVQAPILALIRAISERDKLDENVCENGNFSLFLRSFSSLFHFNNRFGGGGHRKCARSGTQNAPTLRLCFPHTLSLVVSRFGEKRGTMSEIGLWRTKLEGFNGAKGQESGKKGEIR